MSKILVFAEAKDNKFKNSAYEAVTEAMKIASGLNSEIEVVTLGDGIESEAEMLGNYGAKKVNIVSLNQLNSKSGKEGIIYSPSAIAKVISELAKQHNCDIIMLTATSLGKDLTPRLAVMLEAAASPDTTDIQAEGGTLNTMRPVFAGKAVSTLKFNTGKIVVSLRPNVFKPHKVNDDKASIENVNIDSLNITAEDFKTIVKEIKVSGEKLDVAEADIIVSGGRGLKGPENFNLIEDLANALGGATGASRAVVDAGWRPHAEQVGQTGKTVSPTLYVACGISGAIQHLAGMSSSKYIVAINKDKDAPIFQIADYGLVGDVFEILPALTEEIKKVRSN